MSAHHSNYICAKIAQIEVLGNHKSYINQYCQQGLGHPNTSYFSYSDESDEDEPFEEDIVQSTSGNPTPSSEPIITDSSPSLKPIEESNFTMEELEVFFKDDPIS